MSVIRIRFASVFASVTGGYNALFLHPFNGPFFHPLRATKGKTDTDDGNGCIVTAVLGTGLARPKAELSPRLSRTMCIIFYDFLEIRKITII